MLMFEGISTLYWAVMVLIAPGYLGIVNAWKIPFFIWAVLVISMGLFAALSQPVTFESNATQDWDSALIFTGTFFWFLGLVFLSLPYYFSMPGWADMTAIGISILFLAMCFGGSLLELRRRQLMLYGEEKPGHWLPELKAAANCK